MKDETFEIEIIHYGTVYKFDIPNKYHYVKPIFCFDGGMISHLLLKEKLTSNGFGSAEIKDFELKYYTTFFFFRPACETPLIRLGENTDGYVKIIEVIHLAEVKKQYEKRRKIRNTKNLIFLFLLLCVLGSIFFHYFLN